MRSKQLEYKGMEVIVNRDSLTREMIRIKDGKIHVYTNFFARDEDVLRILQRKDSWIRRHMETSKNRIKINFGLDDSTLILGQRIPIVYQKSARARVEFKNNVLYISGSSPQNMQKAYKNFACDILSVMIDRFYREINDVDDFNLSFKYYTSRWGCCYKDRKDIILNVWCVGLPELAIKYVFCHELAHLKVANHQKAFYDEVQRIWPEYKNGLKLSKTFVIT